jgi:hypothetical protein
MRLKEALVKPSGSKYFELLMLNEPVDEEVFKQMLEDQNLILTFNSIVVDTNGEDLMTMFNEPIAHHLRSVGAEIPKYVDPSSYFVSFGRMGYDVKMQCLYVEEKYAFKVAGSAMTAIVPERICADGMQNRFTVLERKKFDSVYREREHELINLRIVLGLTG